MYKYYQFIRLPSSSKMQIKIKQRIHYSSTYETFNATQQNSFVILAYYRLGLMEIYSSEAQKENKKILHNLQQQDQESFYLKAVAVVEC